MTQEKEISRFKISAIITGMQALYLLAIEGMFAYIWMNFYQQEFVSFNTKLFNVVIFAAYFIGYIVFAKIYGSFMLGYKRISELVFSHFLCLFLVNILAYAVFSIAWIRYGLYSILPLILLTLVQVGFAVLWSFCGDKLYYKTHKPKRSVVVYRNERDLERIDIVRHVPKNFVVEKLIRNPESDYIKLFEQIKGFDAIFVSGIEASLRNAIAKYCAENGVTGVFVPHVGDVLLSGAEHLQQFSVPMLAMNRSQERIIYLLVKRAFDIVLSILGIAILSPVFILTALAIFIEDHGPVFYRQVRLTKNGKRFNIIKFRSMKVDAESDGVARLAREDDERITKVGKFIRACRIDELPQLFNILEGSMTIVGPRPERPEIAAVYEEKLPSFRLRLSVKAGLTGYAQVYGKYNTDPYDKLLLDLIYINNKGFFEDLRLIFATVRILIMKESTQGISKDGNNAFDRSLFEYAVEQEMKPSGSECND